MKKKKDDTTKNADGLEAKMELQCKREASFVMMRVSPTTVICVPKEKATKEYAENYYNTKIKAIR